MTNLKVGVEETLNVLINAAKGQEQDALNGIPKFISKLAATIEKPVMSSTCMHCGEGTLQHVGNVGFVIKGLGRKTRAGSILRIVKEMRRQGFLPVNDEKKFREAGEDTPTLELLKAQEVPFYACTNPDCTAFTIQFSDKRQEDIEES